MFSKYGEVESASIVRDPHSRESRGFGFVNFSRREEAEAALDALHGQELHGRAISVDKAKRSKPRVPTPGRYQGMLSHSTSAQLIPATPMNFARRSESLRPLACVHFFCGHS